MDNTIKLIEARKSYSSKKTEQMAEQNDITTEQNDKKNVTEPSGIVMETVSNENFVILNNTIASLSYTLQEHESNGRTKRITQRTFGIHSRFSNWC